jgi:hypothetical protein
VIDRKPHYTNGGGSRDRWFRSQIFVKSLISKKKICEVQRPHASAFGAVGIISAAAADRWL